MASAPVPSDADLRDRVLYLFKGDPTPMMTVIRNLFPKEINEDTEELRQDAQTLFDHCNYHYLNALVDLLFSILKLPNPSTQANCAKLLHRIFSAPDRPFDAFPGMKQDRIKSELLEWLQGPKYEEPLKKVCYLVAEIGGNLLPKYKWDELRKFMIGCLSEESAHKKQCGLLLFAELIPKCPDYFSLDVDELFHVCKTFMIEACEESRVSVTAAVTSVRMILYLLTPASDPKYRDLLAYMVGDLLTLVNSLEPRIQNTKQRYPETVDDHTNVLIILDEMIDMAAGNTEFMRLHISHFIEVMLMIAKHDVVEIESRQRAIEFIITVAEDKGCGCEVVQGLQSEVGEIFSVLLGWLEAIDDDESWADADSDSENAGESVQCCYAMESMSRLANALRGDAIPHNFFDNMQGLLQRRDWKMRHAAVTALGLISEGCSRVFVNHLGRMVMPVLQLMKDLHHRVRWATIQTIGNFCQDLCPDLQEQFHQDIITALTAAFDDFENPRIQTHAASAMLLFSRNCSSSILKPHLRSIVRKLLIFLQRGKTMLQEAALEALASLANSSKEDFEEYYDTIVSYIKTYLFSVKERSDSLLYAKSLECMTMIGVAVGKRKSCSDVQDVARLLIVLQTSHLEAEDPLRYYILQAWGRLCKCLGCDFLPYLKFAMPQLLQSAQIKAFINSTLNADNLDEADDERLIQVAAGFLKVGLKDKAVEEKVLACNILCCIVAELKEELHLWINEVVHALLPLISFNCHVDGRIAAVSAMPLLLQSAASAMLKGLPLAGLTEEPVKSLSANIIPALKDALKKELKIHPPELNLAIWEKTLDALNKCIQISGSRLNKYQVVDIVDSISKVIFFCSSRKTEREMRLKRVTTTRMWEVLKEETALEESVYKKIGDCMGTLIRVFKVSFLPFLEQILPCVELMWGSDSRAEDRKVALSIFRNVAQQCQEGAFRYYQECLPNMFKACTDENPDVREVVAHAIGSCAEYGGPAFKPYAKEGISSLKIILEHPNASRPASIMAKEAAASALGKICHRYCEGINTFQVVSLWLSHLPVQTDLVEAKNVHDLLCSMIETSETKMIGPQGSNIRRIFRICAEVLWAGDNLATPETRSRMIQLLNKFQRQKPGAVDKICSELPLRQQHMLHSILGSTAQTKR